MSVQFTEFAKSAAPHSGKLSILGDYLDGIKILREKGWPYAAIVKALKSLGVETTESQVRVAYIRGYKVRVKSRKKIPADGQQGAANASEPTTTKSRAQRKLEAFLPPPTGSGDITNC